MAKKTTLVFRRRSRESGFSMVELLAGLIATGALAVAVLPEVLSYVDQAEYNSLNHARGTLASAMNVNHAFANKAANGEITVEGETVTLVYGYPSADAHSLSSYSTLTGYAMEKTGENVIIVRSPQNRFCFTYVEATWVDGKIRPAYLSEIESADSGHCGSGAVTTTLLSNL